MKIQYDLSNRQRKELFVRNCPLRIALPLPDRDVGDVKKFASESLPGEFYRCIRAAEIAEMRVAPGGGGGGLDALIGRIVHAIQDGRKIWTIGVAVAIVELEPLGVRRQSVGLTQWPGDVIVDGVSLVREAPPVNQTS